MKAGKELWPEAELQYFLRHQAALAVMVLNREGRILLANDYTRQLAGREPANLLLSEILLDFRRDFNLEELLAAGREVHLFNLNSSSGLPQTLYFRFVDLGDRVLAIAENNHLETENLRRELVALNNSQANLNRELQKKNAELLKLNDLKNQFLGMAAHDLRSPIGAIQTLSSFLLDELGHELSEEHLNFLEIIQNSSNFMLDLLNDLLDIARIEAGKLQLEKQATDLVQLIRENVSLNQLLADKKKIGIVFNPCETIPMLSIDPMKITQVLNNLLSNAVKYSPPGSKVELSVFPGGGQVTVAVADQGPGIPREEMEKLFKPFSRTSVRSREDEKSTGLGLAIVRRIVTGHLGKIWIDSQVGRGSTFYFSLPIEPADNHKKQ